MAGKHTMNAAHGNRMQRREAIREHADIQGVFKSIHKSFTFLIQL
jgi:hypothetical protein